MNPLHFITFNTRPIAGISHIKAGKPCQDFSISWQSEDNENFALIVCDGHGSDTYVRSDVGAKLAAESALSAIQAFIGQDQKWILEKKREVKAGESKDAAFEKLFNTIYQSWSDAINNDAESRPFSDEEETALGSHNLVKAYGSTLMAYVQTPLYWFAFQIGDGRLLASNRRIEWKQIVPWDENCFLNSTTSLCNTNPVPLFRYAFDATGNFPAAVFCCSDGIEDSWGDYEVAPEKLHDFYSNLVSEFFLDGKDSTIGRLEEFLPKLSDKGSKDDMSLSGYINLLAVATGLEMNNIKEKISQIEEEKEEALELLNHSVTQLSDKIRQEKKSDILKWTERVQLLRNKDHII